VTASEFVLAQTAVTPPSRATPRESYLLRGLSLLLHPLITVHLLSGYRPMTRGRRLYTGRSNSALAHGIFFRHHGTNVWLPHHRFPSILHYGTPGASALILLFSAEHAPHILPVLLLVTLRNILCPICFKNWCRHPPVALT
jgi:hypothetical protein